MRASPNVLDALPLGGRARVAAIPRDLGALTLSCVAFVATALLLSRRTGAPFVVPRGQSPALGTNFSLPLVAALVGYAVLQVGARLFAQRRGRREPWTGHLLVDFYLLALFVLVIYVHFHIKMWVPLINPSRYDAAYFAVDERLRFAIEALRSARRALATVLPAPDIWYELAFFSMFSLSFWCHAAGRRRWHYHNMVAITLTELVGALLYLVAPAVGPFLYERGDNPHATAVQLRMYEQYSAFQAGGVSWLAEHGGHYFTAPLAAMPSLHFAATFVLAYYAVRARLLIAPLVVAATCWIGIESVVSRWHYLVDLPVGLAVALAAIAIANRLCRFRLEAEIPDEPAELEREEPGAPRLPALEAAGPRIWILMGQRAGDNGQLLALAEGLAGSCEPKRMAYRRFELLTNLLFDASLLGRIGARSSSLGPPWPDLVLSAGRRSEPIARWIRRHADRPVRLVHLGRPWRRAEAFDLVVATPQYALAPQPCVLHNPLPLHRVTAARLADAARRFEPRLARLPRPWIAVLVGGSSELFTLGARTAARLASEAGALARASGGSLLVTTSARTSRRAAAALRAAIDVPAEIFAWGADARENPTRENPYWGYLALADAFVVTGDSVSMLTEACATGKPVHIFDPGRGGAGRDVRARVRRRILGLGMPRLARDLRRVHEELVERGHATLFGAPVAAAPRSPPAQLERTIARVQALLAAPLAHAAGPPRVWTIACARAGDDSQIGALAEALGWPVEVKRLSYRRLGRLFDVWRGSTLLGIDRGRSSPLEPPWPDLVISASMRNEPVCRWIREQSAGETRYVHVGKPWARPASFDLVITQPEYHRLPRLPNVLHGASSLHRVTPARLAEEASLWAPRVAELPRPLVAVLVGGYAGPYAFDREKAERLGREASSLAKKRGGSLLVTTSARTSRAATDALVAAIDVPFAVFRWHRDARANPFLGFLALAESIIVTCDSTSMLAEACATRKPVHMFDLARDGPADGAPPLARPERARLARAWQRCNQERLKALLYRQLMLRFAPRNLVRDIGAVHRALLSSGRAVWLGQPFPRCAPPPLDATQAALEQVRALFAEPTRGGGLSGAAAYASVPPMPTPREAPPRIWLLVGEKAGDNAQLRVIADALGWPVEERRIAMQAAWVRGKPRVRASLAHIDAQRSDALEPPWPDLVLAIGRRLSMVALWVREQSGGHSKLVLVGKPRRLAHRFDLVVASAQYRVAHRQNVLQLGLPLMRVDPAAVADAAGAWRERLAGLARPLTAVLVGGPTKPVRFDAAVARELAAHVASLGAGTGGSLYVTTSRRTPDAVVDALAAALPPGTPLYRWSPEASDNPHLALLGLADRFVVTSDSLTMMVEVARLGRPLAIFALPPGRGALGRLWRTLARGRDLDAVPRMLIERGIAVPLGAPFRPPSQLPPDELRRVVARIRALLDPSGAATDAPQAGV